MTMVSSIESLQSVGHYIISRAEEYWVDITVHYI